MLTIRRLERVVLATARPGYLMSGLSQQRFVRIIYSTDNNYNIAYVAVVAIFTSPREDCISHSSAPTSAFRFDSRSVPSSIAFGFPPSQKTSRGAEADQTCGRRVHDKRCAEEQSRTGGTHDTSDEDPT